jgi:hypothetical protein
MSVAPVDHNLLCWIAILALAGSARESSTETADSLAPYARMVWQSAIAFREVLSTDIHSIRMAGDPAVTTIVTIYSQSGRSSRPLVEKNAFIKAFLREILLPVMAFQILNSEFDAIYFPFGLSM